MLSRGDRYAVKMFQCDDAIERRPLRGQDVSRCRVLSRGDRYAVKMLHSAACYREETATRSRCFTVRRAIERRPLRGQDASQCRVLSRGNRYAVKMFHAVCDSDLIA